jgi:hypothetical protein
VVEVHVLFKLPSHLGTYHHPLAYVHWFKPTWTYDNHFDMFHLSHLTRQGIPNAEVIPINHIVQQCHLIPSFPHRAINPRWFQGHALAEVKQFYLNKYIDLHIFEQYRLHTNGVWQLVSIIIVELIELFAFQES